MMEAEEITDDLEIRHGENCYTREHYNVWAHMIQMRKHHSHGNAHDKPSLEVPNQRSHLYHMSLLTLLLPLVLLVIRLS